MTGRSARTLGVVALCSVCVAVAALIMVQSFGGEDAPSAQPSSSLSPAAHTPTPSQSTVGAPSTVETESPLPTPASSATPAEVPPSTSTQAPNKVSVVVTFSGSNAARATVEAGGYAEVVEAGARCTLQLSRNSVVLTEVADALPDATTTSCGVIAVPISRLTAGTWSGQILYSSATARGESSPFVIEVP